MPVDLSDYVRNEIGDALLEGGRLVLDRAAAAVELGQPIDDERRSIVDVRWSAQARSIAGKIAVAPFR